MASPFPRTQPTCACPAWGPRWTSRMESQSRSPSISANSANGTEVPPFISVLSVDLFEIVKCIRLNWQQVFNSNVASWQIITLFSKDYEFNWKVPWGGNYGLWIKTKNVVNSCFYQTFQPGIFLTTYHQIGSFTWLTVSLRCPNRYLQPPGTWIQCALESRELLALCLKKIKGSMSKVSSQQEVCLGVSFRMCSSH